ncbi:hypothetical protein [Shewanella sp. SR44-3]|uniref:hypothetical protein n=1 Tax=unclassified Shewanella TaxID=196818 RepID=UPI0028739A2E|nr:hypothetical protein [Shewanella sp. SR44-3]
MLEQQRYEELIAELPRIIRAKTGLSQTYKQIESAIHTVDKLTQKIKDDSASLKAEKIAILAEYEAVNKKRADKSQQLFKLKTEITNRLLADLSKPDSSLPVTINGSTECSKYQSIADCLKESKSGILSSTRNESPFLNEKSVLLSYEVLDANMNMKGELTYKATMQFKPSYNNKTDIRLNEELGLKSAMITLISNVPADWYINGVKIGTGSKLSHEIPLGKHGILASYKNQDKSSVEKIEASGTFNYKFNQSSFTTPPNSIAKEAAETNSKGVSKQTMQQPTTKKSDTTYTFFPDTSSDKLDDKDPSADKINEFFMGITPVAKKQTIEITNEPIEK